MMRFWISAFPLAIVISLGQTAALNAQDAQNPTSPTDEQQQKEKADREKKALMLLDQIVDDAQLLRLPENRINVQINTADLLWERNQPRARTLFVGAGDSIAEMMRNSDPNEERRRGGQSRTVSQLRQQLVLTAAGHDATLAYQLLAATRPIAPAPTDGRDQRRSDSEDNLEQMLLSRIAALDPKMALQNAELLLDKGQFPRALASVLVQLQRKDKEAAAKLEDKMLKRLRSTNLLANMDAGSLALNLLRPGPREADKAVTDKPEMPNRQTQVLGESAYVDLMGTVIDAALKAVPQTSGNNPRGANNARGRGISGTGGGGSNNGPSSPNDAQIEQANARTLMNGIRSMVPHVERYFPSRATAVREKLNELGMADNRRAAMNQVFSLMQQGSTDSILDAARTAPQQLQPRIYQQAAIKALEEGNPDRAQQIASDHLQGTTRDRVLQQVEFKRIAEKSEATRLDELRLTLSGLRSDDERIDLLIQLAANTRQKNPQLAMQFLEQAKQLTNRRAVNYQQFEQQLKVADAFRELEPARSFEVLEFGIAQLNELLSAAATLSGFEVNVFKEGELPLESRNNLSGMVSQYGRALGMLARSDFERAQTLANRFQLNEPRILARMSIVQGLLGSPSRSSIDFNLRGIGPDVRPPE